MAWASLSASPGPGTSFSPEGFALCSVAGHAAHLHRQVMQLGFARVVAVQAPFLQDANGNVKVVVAQVVQISQLKLP